AAADDGFSAKRFRHPCEAEPRAEDGGVTAINIAIACAGKGEPSYRFELAGRDLWNRIQIVGLGGRRRDGAGSGWVKAIHRAVVALSSRSFMFPAESDVEGEVRPGARVVLDEEGIVSRSHCVLRIKGACSRAATTMQKVGQIIAE